MANRRTMLTLFLSSYAPLLLIFGIFMASKNLWLSIGLMLASIGSIMQLLRFLKEASTLTSHSVIAQTVQSRDGEAMSYIVTYLLPFLGIDFSKWENGVALIILFVILGILYVNSNLIYVNPMLNLFGYHIFELQTSEGKLSALIARRKYVKNGEAVNVVSLGNYVIMEKIQ